MPRALLSALVRLALAFVLWSAAARADGDGSLLAGLSPIETRHVRRAAVMNDGVAPPEGDPWKTNMTTELVGTDAFVLYDLGAPHRVVAAFVQADNNDNYVIEVSDDLREFRIAWEAAPVPEVGLRSRSTTSLSAAGRYVRVRATRGDQSYALGEVLLYERVPAAFPPKLRRASGVPLDELVRDRVVVLAIAIMAATLLAYRGAHLAWSLALLLLPLLAAASLGAALGDAFPIAPRGVSLVRGAAAAIALAALARERVRLVRFPFDRRFTIGALAIAGVTAVLAFYNLGAPQFRDVSRGTSAFAHYPDLRQYHPTARFFSELGYRGIYEADVAAYAELTGTTVESLASRPMRDLSDARQDVTTIGRKTAAIAARRARFSPERWEAYKHDVQFFREVMGDDQYLETMIDYGAYATPVWIATGHLLWLGAPSRAAFTATGLLDLALIALAFAAIGRAFGLRTMLVAMVVFGANDLVVFGTDWAGATLRHDWLAYLALGACALKLGKPSLAGGLLAAAAMIRAFPALAIAAVALPVAWSILDHRREHGRWPTIAEVRAQNEDAERFFFAVALTAAALFVVSSLVLSTSAWPEWYAKVTEGQSLPHMSDVSFRALVGGASAERNHILARRWPAVLAGGGLVLACIVVASRRVSPGRAMILGLPLVPMLLNPTSYYAHATFLLVLALPGRAEGDATSDERAIWTALLAMCVGQYFAQLIPDQALHFYLDTALLMITIGIVVLCLARERAREFGWLERR